MHADLAGALKQINKSYKAFEHKGKPLTKEQVIKVLKYGLSKGYKTTAELTDDEVDKVLFNGSILPPMGQVVVANVKFTCNWPKSDILITYKEMLVKRIKSSANSTGWQWSGDNPESYINGDVVSWHYI